MKYKYLDYDWTPVINFETGGERYYTKYLSKATWPGGASGVTVGIGADLGYMKLKEFNNYFSKYFSVSERANLKRVIGVKGSAARSKLNTVKGVELSWDEAYEAFVVWTLPKFWSLSTKLWPGLEDLCEPAQIALVSIVFNRGSSTRGSSRKEMFNIKKLVRAKDYIGIARQIRSMKRLWIGKGLDGLIKRREIEAKMVENCI